MTTNSSVANVQQNQPAKTGSGTVKDLMQSDQFKEAVKQALPSHISPDRFVRVALTALTRTPKLAECSKESLFKAMLDCSALGLEPDGRRAHLIPYGNQVQLIIDYKGLIELAKRSGEVKTWRAELVCEAERDTFKWKNGVIEHEINWLAPRGKVLAVYSHVRNANGDDDFEIMTLEQIEAIRNRSKSKNSGPWVTDFEEMAKKTVIRRHSKRLTLSPEFIEAVERENEFDEVTSPTLEVVMPKRLSERKAQEAQEQVQDEISESNVVENVPHETISETVTEQVDSFARISAENVTKVMTAFQANGKISKKAFAEKLAEFGYKTPAELKNRDLDLILNWLLETSNELPRFS